MTVFTNNVTFWPPGPHQGKVRLWADTEDELFAAALDARCELTDFEDTGAFPCFFLTEDQQAVAIFNGACMSDWLGPREWRARRENDSDMLDWIAETRRRGYRAAA